jgi:hypothetical protein
VRTSPDHGTAFDIAGTGRADAASLVAAMRMARQLAHEKRPRQRHGARTIRLRLRPLRLLLEAVADLAQQQHVFRRGRPARAAAAGASRLRRLICLTIMKMMNARMAKLTAMVMKLP